MEENEWLICNCCGHIIRNNVAENTHYGESPYPDDEGFGMCVDCGGDKDSTSFKKRLGWAGRIFYDARIAVLKDTLDPERKAKFEAVSYEKQVTIVAHLIEKGAMI